MFDYLQALSPTKKNEHSVGLEIMKKEFRRPRRVREENFKNGLGEIVCKKVDSTMCLA